MRLVRNQSAGKKPKRPRRKPGEPIKRKGTPPDPNPRPGAPGRHPTRRNTEAYKVLPPVVAPTVDVIEQDRRHLELVVSTALQSGMGPRTTASLIMEQHKVDGVARWTWEVVYQCINRVQALWLQDFEDNVGTYRARQVERLQQDLARERAKPHPSLVSLRGHEELLARITGTMKPVRVEVDVMATLKHSIAAVIVDLSELEKDAIVAQQLELEALARRVLPAQAAE